MATYYNTARGTSYDPMPVEVWRHDGQGALFRVELAESVKVTWADRTTGTAEFDLKLDNMTAPLTACDGMYLFVVTLNGHRHASTPVKAAPYNDGDTDEVRVKFTTASPWNLLTGERVPPVPDRPLSQQESAEFYVATGPVETVVKSLVSVGAARLGHPIAVLPSLGNGPTVTVSSRFDTVAELVEGALAGTGYRLSLDVWLPGDEKIGDLSLTKPTIVADVVPYRDREGLVWARVSADLDQWQLDKTRATSTQVVVGDRGEGVEQHFVLVETTDEVASPWAKRETFVSVTDEATTLLDAGTGELLKSAATTDLDATIAPAGVWEYGSDGEYPLQFSVGDVATIDLGDPLGEVRQVVTEVTAELTPTEFTVTPKVSTPDTMERDIYATLTDLQRRVGRPRR